MTPDLGFVLGLAFVSAILARTAAGKRHLVDGPVATASRTAPDHLPRRDVASLNFARGGRPSDS
jgi:hypothetical protein